MRFSFSKIQLSWNGDEFAPQKHDNCASNQVSKQTFARRAECPRHGDRLHGYGSAAGIRGTCQWSEAASVCCLTKAAATLRTSGDGSSMALRTWSRSAGSGAFQYTMARRVAARIFGSREVKSVPLKGVRYLQWTPWTSTPSPTHCRGRILLWIEDRVVQAIDIVTWRAPEMLFMRGGGAQHRGNRHDSRSHPRQTHRSRRRP
jgi:hypothetical protein